MLKPIKEIIIVTPLAVPVYHWLTKESLSSEEALVPFLPVTLTLGAWLGIGAAASFALWRILK